MKLRSAPLFTPNDPKKGAIGSNPNLVVQAEEAKWQADLDAWRSGHTRHEAKEQRQEDFEQAKQDHSDKALPPVKRRGSLTSSPLSDPNNRLTPLPKPLPFNPSEFQ